MPELIETQEVASGPVPAAAAGLAPVAAEDSLLDRILAESMLSPEDESYAIAKQGVSALVGALLDPEREGQRVDKAVVDGMIAELDQRISAQLNEVLHHPEFQALESTWRSLKYLVDEVDFRENTRLEILNCSKDDLRNDFEDAPEIVKSGLYRLVYSGEFGTFGGKPYGAMVSMFDIGPGAQDMELLASVAAVAAMSHAPFLTNASPEFFGTDSYLDLPMLKDLDALFEGPQYARWHAFRDSEDARYVGMTVPRFLLRMPYGEKSVPLRSFRFEEAVTGDHQAYLWGPASVALAARVADSFAKYRWCPNIVGPQAGGAVEHLPLHCFEAMGELQVKVPTEVQLTERREFELSEQGFIGLTFRKDTNNAAFFSANSAQRPKTFGNAPDAKELETNHRLGTQLPYMFVVSRLAHYVKVLQREQIGSWKERSDLERELNSWIGQYVADMENPAPQVRSRRPLRQAQIEVRDVPGQPGWYQCMLKVRPHFKYMGASFELSLVGKLDKR